MGDNKKELPFSLVMLMQISFHKINYKGERISATDVFSNSCHGLISKEEEETCAYFDDGNKK
jgi:hypothetical protein